MIKYEGEILQGGNIADGLFSEISKQNELVVLKNGEGPYKVVIGVPHQAKVGVSHICENDRDSDENAASYAIVAFNSLKERGVSCKLVIMAHATLTDPNKDKDMPYFIEIFEEQAEMLFECHGAGQNRRLDIEVSAGRNSLSRPVDFGRTLAHYMGNRYSIGIQKDPGKAEAHDHQYRWVRNRWTVTDACQQDRIVDGGRKERNCSSSSRSEASIQDS